MQVDEDDGDEITAVTYHGTSYDVGTPNSVVLIVTLPLSLIAHAIVVLNGRALRRGRSASPAGTPRAGREH